MSEIIHGNCIEVLKRLDENSIDAIITDPPYELGFMGKSWDKSGIAFSSEVWAECLRVLKPGGHMLAFGGSRTFHRIAVAIEDAGFELRDTLMWVYGSGFPKSLDVSKAIDKTFGAKRTQGAREWSGGLRHSNSFGGGSGQENGTTTLIKYDNPATPEAQMWHGWGTALKPAFEPIILARKPISEKNIAENVLKWGTGGINIDDCRVETDDTYSYPNGPGGCKSGNFHYQSRADTPAQSNPLGRWPANFIHDGSEEVLKLFPETNSNSAARFFYCAKASRKERNKGLEDLQDRIGGAMLGTADKSLLTGSGNPRNNIMKNNHPTVKPLALMQYIVRLITPPNGIVLDPFAGSGSTLIAAIREGFKYIGIELNEEYIEIAEKRLQAEQPLFEYNNT